LYSVQSGGRRSRFTQSYLSSDADQQLVHAVVEQRRDFDELAVTPRSHVLTVCTHTKKHSDDVMIDSMAQAALCEHCQGNLSPRARNIPKFQLKRITAA